MESSVNFPKPPFRQQNFASPTFGFSKRFIFYFVFITSWIKTLSLTFIHTSMEYKPNFLKVFFSSKEIIFKTAKKKQFFDFHMLGFSVNLRENSQIFSFFGNIIQFFFHYLRNFLFWKLLKSLLLYNFPNAMIWENCSDS